MANCSVVVPSGGQGDKDEEELVGWSERDLPHVLPFLMVVASGGGELLDGEGCPGPSDDAV